MRYRAGGIGHKYMRVIEETYENMSRERTHHKEHKRKDVPSRDVMDVDNESAVDDEQEADMTTGPSHTNKDPGVGEGCEGDEGDEGGEGGNTDGDNEGEESDGDKPGSDSDQPEGSDSDDVDSEGD